MYKNTTEHGIIIVLSSPSGAGKTSLATSIVSENRNILFSVSATTRLPRSGEVDGREYHFMDRPKFSRMIKNGDFIEYAEVFGNFYGTPKKDIQKLIHLYVI